MKNGDKIRWNGSNWIYINGVYFINDEIKGNFKDILNENIEDLHKLSLFLPSRKK